MSPDDPHLGVGYGALLNFGESLSSMYLMLSLF